MSVDQVSIGQMSVCQLPFGQMSVSQMSVVQMSFGQMSVGQMSFSQMSVCQMSVAKCLLAKCLTAKCLLATCLPTERRGTVTIRPFEIINVNWVESQEFLHFKRETDSFDEKNKKIIFRYWRNKLARLLWWDNTVLVWYFQLRPGV